MRNPHAIWHAPGEVRPRVLLAKLLLERDPAGALRHAQRACDLAPGDVGTRLLLADALIANGRSQEGISLYGEALERLPAEHPLRRPVEERLKALKGDNGHTLSAES